MTDILFLRNHAIQTAEGLVTQVTTGKWITTIGKESGKRIQKTTENFFSYLIRPDGEICLPSKTAPSDIHVLVMICSAARNFAARDAIRKTWLSEHALRPNHTSIHKVFIIGNAYNKSLHGLLQIESTKHRDIVQGNFLDTYNNLTLKSIFALQWASQYCNQADFIIKGDDDAYININNLVRYAVDKHLKNTFLGYCLTGIRPERNPVSKWYVPRSIFPGNSYPPFVAGWAYVMPGHLLIPLYNATRTLPFLHLEDIFITGLCGGKLGARHRGHPGFQARLNMSDTHMLKSFFAVHFVTVEDHYRFWEAIKKLEPTI
ncbi:beta-1,3-galactosyltransferase 5 [Lingula anatina]|uniref:Hexosyltransferase n=1 Tax=Lingula anatina TaxID=7574 RepID=A0A1S3JCZ0_LINAN|nr:beta-1,3-galactosyltransferase 5 [Lingula anatina]XP_013407754.1 beta-1,3-galactosyltransferase 5 [Lingula anatina]XP_013407761.1 beta-1,3-galactosyltransferase 5 [Lingula anatina]XP_013407770.1 beta-1,3-galactosyltransferase 5 [Lingula anatina]|eukprot:XP_013407745.1 beta-1,3-galactosyltransferase 5 [Lingula anatina]